MPYMVDCYEWHLLQELGTVLKDRKSFFQPSSTGRFEGILGAERVHFEAELRRVFSHPEAAIDLEDGLFHEFSVQLRQLCGLLDRSVREELLRDGIGPMTEQHDRTETPYPQLNRLVHFLQTSTERFDLADGPSQTIFGLPIDLEELRGELNTVSGCNDFISQLYTTPPYTPSPPVPKTNQKYWKTTGFRDQAAGVFHTLFERFKCGMHHEVLLKISDSSNSLVQPRLFLLLPSCSVPESWQQIQCDLSEDEHATAINDVCRDLQHNANEEKILRLLAKPECLFGVWTERSTGESLDLKSYSNQSLDQLVRNGAFLSKELSYIYSPSAPLYTEKEKRQLAVNLGYCFLDFFDSDLNSHTIHLFLPPDNKAQGALAYLSFSSRIPLLPEFRVFEAGNPVFLSFAKLLLEIEHGKTIDDIEVNGNTGSNLNNWGELLRRVEKAQRTDTYYEAIRSCLYVHIEISKSLRRKNSRPKKDMKIRKEFYRQVVSKLEDGLNKSSHRPRNKRARSESPRPIKEDSDLLERDTQGPLHGRSSQERTVDLTSKRQKINYMHHEDKPKWYPRHEGRYAPNILPSDHFSQPLEAPRRMLGASGSFDDCGSAEHPRDSCIYADRFLERHKETYRRVIRDICDEEDQFMKDGVESQQPMISGIGLRVKVAILDTGLDTTHSEVQAVNDQIKDIRSWVNGLNGAPDWEAGDDSGHGTHVAMLLLTVAPDCDIYIARIAKTQPLGADRIAKAVLHAVTEWQVDIISMSFGFTDEAEHGCDALTQAIATAHSQNILMFAAASNSGSHALPAFPARHSSVFCIHSSDGLGNSAPANPTAQMYAYNFSTLGQAVESAWPRLLCRDPWRKRKSGTSFAAPVAVGIAATVLLYARQNMPAEEARRFKEYNKMRDVLHCMSDYRNYYHVISTREFFNSDPKHIRLVLEMIVYGQWKR